MNAACFIPIKANSERVKGKNLRLLNGRKLYEYICEHVTAADVFDDVFIDTNSQEIADYARSSGFKVIDRKPELAKNSANGNDLLVYHFEQYPDYDYYFQLFATAPYMQPETISICFHILTSKSRHESAHRGNNRPLRNIHSANKTLQRKIRTAGRKNRQFFMSHHKNCAQKIPPERFQRD